MVAIVAGSGLGIFNTSAQILGGLGILGQGVLGQARGRSYVNAASGNLVLQFQDEGVSGRGLDLTQLRTYNSQGQLSDGLGSGWSLDGERTVVLVEGAAGVSGVVVRRDGQGHESSYTWNGNAYVSTEGDGAHDVLRYQDHVWTWTDGSSRLEERYGDSTSSTMIGRLQSRRDTSGNLIRLATRTTD